MADIKTKKDLVTLVADPNPSGINFQVVPGALVMSIKNEGVTHDCFINVQEGTQMGVAILQLIAQAQALLQHEQMKQRANAIVMPGNQ